MGLYFTKILFKRVGEASKNAFFFEILYTGYDLIEMFLFQYFKKYYYWYGNRLIADYLDVNKGGFSCAYDFNNIRRQIFVGQNQLKIKFEEKIRFQDNPIVYNCPPQY